MDVPNGPPLPIGRWSLPSARLTSTALRLRGLTLCTPAPSARGLARQLRRLVDRQPVGWVGEDIEPPPVGHRVTSTHAAHPRSGRARSSLRTCRTSSASTGDGRSPWLEHLATLGYSVRHALLDALRFELPQRRERLFVVGTLGSVARADAALVRPPSGVPGHVQAACR